jgi:hypothetical protein
MALLPEADHLGKTNQQRRFASKRLSLPRSINRFAFCWAGFIDAFGMFYT